MKNKKLFGLAIIFTSLLLNSCNRVNSFPPSNAFYINDQANALLSSTQYLIYYYSSELYDVNSQKEEYKKQKVNGTQVVVATYMGEINSINTTEIFNKWEIGANDMGLLLMLYFAPNPADERMPTYLGMSREIGSQLSGFISMIRLEEIFINTWENSMFESVHRQDYDYKLAYFYINVLKEIYVSVYNDNTFDSEGLIDSYDRNQYNSYYNLIPQGSKSDINIKWWVWLLIGLGVLFLISTGRFWWVLLFTSQSRHSGGGGKSRGYKYTR